MIVYNREPDPRFWNCKHSNSLEQLLKQAFARACFPEWIDEQKKPPAPG